MAKQLNRSAIKQMEKAQRAGMLKNIRSNPKDIQPLMSFDEWYIVKSPLIPAQHRKEILRADFKARGLVKKHTMQQFDEALAKYGVKIG
jgi:hypothetical protein